MISLYDSDSNYIEGYPSMAREHDDQSAAITLDADFPIPKAGLEGIRQDMLAILSQERPVAANDLYVIEKLAKTARELLFAADPKARVRGRAAYNNQIQIFSATANNGASPEEESGSGTPELGDPATLGSALAPSSSAETFGTQAVRELVATLQKGTGDPMVDLLTAYTTAREMGFKKLAAIIKAQIEGLETEAEAAASPEEGSPDEAPSPAPELTNESADSGDSDVASGAQDSDAGENGSDVTTGSVVTPTTTETVMTINATSPDANTNGGNDPA